MYIATEYTDTAGRYYNILHITRYASNAFAVFKQYYFNYIFVKIMCVYFI